MSSKKELNSTLMMAFTVTTLLGFINAQAVGSKDLFRCRQSCYQKFVQDWHHCMDFEDCKNCWNNCDQQLGPFPLNVNSALRQGSLVLTTIAWDQAITNASKQCLVTWEVSGGGLMGNLLTDSSTVELSLWPETVYHVQVTCKHKETGGMRRSYKLIVDTQKLSDINVHGMQAITLETGNMASKEGMMPHLYGADSAVDIGGNSGETDSRMRILKDSSKDFLSPYNPNANVATASSTTSSSFKAPVTTSATTKSSATSTVTARRTDGVAAPAEDENSVLRNRLVDERPLAQWVANFLDQHPACGKYGPLVLLVIVVILYVYLRPRVRKHMEAVANAVDREVLIHKEMLPSQTPQALRMSAALAASHVEVAVAPKQEDALAARSEPSAAASNPQTLHV
ncbi:uncharacterized protein LOC126758323 isoform X2 [Bactrocera neohumeralis]|uniref:uncharacterized protein LOC126758323 isoform X2 n=1 Tax=Bactrocera neohumeralis TaxID=98809 RepID=UPI0021667E48|nr:uncharacterized protein LOC126758323 isoform X2 [Bactrocera neohumeralis]